MNLLTIPNLYQTFGTVVGLSDHSVGSTVAIAAVALGASIVEKHFILDRSMGGPDSAFSIEPDESKAMIKTIRDVEKALGNITYEIPESVKNNRQEFSRSLFVVQDVRSGDLLTESNVRSIRPGYGLSPRFLKQVIGKKARKAAKRGTPLSWDLID